jgi:hypothetical protein
MKESDEYEELSIWNIKSIMDYIKENFIQILLFISVFIIIYIVDYISNINAVLFSMPPPIPGIENKKLQPVKLQVPKKRKNFKK